METIEKIKLTYNGKENSVKIFDVITMMRNRLEDREEHFKQGRKDDQIKKNNQLKIIEEQMKDRVIYKERRDFIAWCYDMKIFIQGIPDSVDDSMKIGYIKRTIENKDLKDALQICKTSSEVLTTIADRHIDDKNIIGDLFPIPHGGGLNGPPPQRFCDCAKTVRARMLIFSDFL